MSQRRRALKNNMMYCARTRRDPPPNTGESGGESAKEDVDGMLCGSGAVVDTTPLCTGLPVYSRPHGVDCPKIDLGCFYLGCFSL